MSPIDGSNPKQDWTRFFRDANGKIVIAQFPNWPLWVWLAATGVELFAPLATLVPASRVISFLAITYWAYLEIVSGVNTFRRALGVTVMLFVLFSRFENFIA